MPVSDRSESIVRSHAARRPRGTAYLLAIGLSLLVAVVATGTILATRARFAGDSDAVDLMRVRSAAEGAIAVALARLNGDASLLEGGVASAVSGSSIIDGVRMRWRIEATQAAEKGLPTSTIIAQADAGHALRRYEVVATPARTPHSAFQQALAVAGTLGVSAGAQLKIEAPDVATAGTLVVPAGATLSGEVNQVGLGAAAAIDALDRTLVRPTMPSSDQIAALKAIGQPLTVSASGGITLTNLLLSPTSNPLGALSQRGVYVLNAGGRVLTITGLRIVGTLIIVNPGPGSSITGGTVGEAAVPGAPCLIVEGSIFLNGTPINLTEGTTNFNPQGTPFPFIGGVVDTDTADVRPNQFAAPVLITGTLALAGTMSFAGLVVGGDCAVGGDIEVTRDPAAADSPPEELQLARWRLDRATWTEVLPGS